ncbi:MAG: AMP-binding protein, partial [Acidobacteriia bacterium]|nr:AMP-binding protein [Terriglobia bacterium]
MTIDTHRLDRLDANAKRELLARLLRERPIASGEPFELSLGQEALWFLHELAPDSTAYNVAFCVRVLSEVDSERLEGALLKLLERHPMLRCTFVSGAQGPRQCIGPVPQRSLELVDASDWSEEELRGRVHEYYRRPFDFASGPIFRSTLFRRRGTGHVLLISAHHIVFDAWSLGIVLSDLATLYESGAAAVLPPKAGSYAGFVKWQQTMIESEEGREAWGYWRSRLERTSSTIDLPTDHPRPSVQSFQGATFDFNLPATLALQIRGLARAENTTPYTVLAAAFHALLHRYTGAPEVPIGTPLVGRSQQEFEHTVGYFVNPVVLCARVESGTTFRQHLAAMREATIAALQYGDFPFLEIVKRLQPARDPSRTPLFQVMLNLMKTTQVGVAGEVVRADSAVPLRLGSLAVEAFPLRQQEGQFDLDLDLLDTGAAMPAVLKYSTDLFEAGTIERMAGHFVTLLSAAVADPDRRIADLPLLTDQERTQVLVNWNATAKVYPETTIHRLIEEQVRRAPTATALVFEGRAMSYDELNRRDNQLARHLRGMGVGPDTLVGVCIERSFEMVVALLGVLKAGGAYVPVDPGYPADRQAYMIEDSRAPVLLTQANLAGGWANAGARVVVLDTGWEEIARQPGEDLQDGAQPDHLAYVIYTSGSTGKPKGAMNTHRAVSNRLLWMQDT